VLFDLVNKAFYALKFIEKYLILISAKITDNQYFISVKYNRIGMSEKVKAKIFRPFFSFKPAGQGHRFRAFSPYVFVVNGHGGNVEVESEDGFGTTFMIKLPIS
jgi:two-component system, NtrC family, sensor kinase